MLWGITVDRTPRFFDEGDGRFPISFGDGQDDALGRPVNVHARLGQCRYWIDGSARIRQVERIARGLRVVTTFEAFTRATPGRILPAQTTTCTWDLASGALLSSESVHDSHRRIEHVWLPSDTPDQRKSGRDPGRDLARRARAALTPGRQFLSLPLRGRYTGPTSLESLRRPTANPGGETPCKAIRGSSTC